MKLATIETVEEVNYHPDADLLDVVKVKGYQCIVSRDSMHVGKTVVFIQPDSVLPKEPHFELFNKRASRVRAAKLRGVWSFGIAMNIDTFPPQLARALQDRADRDEIGADVADLLGIIKYEAPQPQCLDARGNLPNGLPKTDEERFQNLEKDLRYGETVDVTLKIDGQSATFFCFKQPDGSWNTGVCSRSLTMKEDKENNYTRVEKKYNILATLREFCVTNDVSLALRGEVYGGGVQGFSKNPHSKLPLDLMLYNTWNHDKRCYESPVSQYNYKLLGALFGIPVVPVIEEATILTKALIERYSVGITKIAGKPFEGVVVKYHTNGDSFKIINLDYDTNK